MGPLNASRARSAFPQAKPGRRPSRSRSTKRGAEEESRKPRGDISPRGFLFSTSISNGSDQTEHDQESASEPHFAAARVVPFVERVRVAARSAGAERDGGKAQRDGDIGI